MSCPLGACDGSGAIRYVEEELRDPVDIGGGLTIMPGTTYGTRLCPCRWREKPVDGDARWWTSRPLYSMSGATAVHRETWDVSVTAEVPISDDNRRVRDRGNRYYPCAVDLEVSDESMRWLWPAEARELAAALMYAADVAEAFDAADSDRCGHWAPCDCAEAQA